MFSDVSTAFLPRTFYFDYAANFSKDFIDNDYIEIENIFSRHFSSEEPKPLLIEDSKSTFLSSKLSINSLISLDEEDEEKKEENFQCLIESRSTGSISNSNPISSEGLKEKKLKPFFKVEYPKKYTLFTKSEKNSILIREERNLLKKKRSSLRKPRRDNQDNMRKKIKRGFFNTALINILNEKLETIKSNKYFEKFPQIFIADVDQKRNKEIFNMTLKDIFEKKELYNREKNSGLNNYFHNLKVVQSEDIKNNGEFKVILNKTISELYEEYINSDEFKIGEINRLKKKNMNDDYVKKYICLSNHLIQFFSK